MKKAKKINGGLRWCNRFHSFFTQNVSFPELRLCNQTQFTWSFKKNRFEEANIYLLQQDAQAFVPLEHRLLECSMLMFQQAVLNNQQLTNEQLTLLSSRPLQVQATHATGQGAGIARVSDFDFAVLMERCCLKLWWNAKVQGGGKYIIFDQVKNKK